MAQVIDGIIKRYDTPVQDLLNSSSNILEEILLYGLYIIDIIITENKHIKSISTKVLILMLRDMLESLDSICILIKKGCMTGAIPSLRTVFELYLSILFIIKDNTEDRAIAYDVCHIHRKLQAGEFIKANNGENVDDTIKLLKDKLAMPEYSKVSHKWEKYKKEKGYPPNWYNITSESCTSIRGLAIRRENWNYIILFIIIFLYMHMEECPY